MNVKIEMRNGTVIANIIGEIDHHTAKIIRESIDAYIERTKPKLLIIDFASVTFMDSSGIGLIMGRYKIMRSFGGGTQVANASPQIKKIMRLAGLDRLAVIDKAAKV